MYLNGLVLTRKETLVAVETGWAADVKFVGFHCCFKIDMRLVLESKGSTSHHCCSLQVAAFVVHLPSKVAREDITPIPICSEASTSDKGRGYPCGYLEAPQLSDAQAYRDLGPRSHATHSVEAVF